jgi:hypothetical protein
MPGPLARTDEHMTNRGTFPRQAGQSSSRKGFHMSDDTTEQTDETCPPECVETNHPDVEHDEWVAESEAPDAEVEQPEEESADEPEVDPDVEAPEVAESVEEVVVDHAAPPAVDPSGGWTVQSDFSYPPHL